MGKALTARGRATPPACVRRIANLAVSEGDLRAVNLPVGVIVGDQDPEKRLYVDPLIAIREDWPTVLVTGAGHLNCIAREQSKQALSAWFSANSQSHQPAPLPRNR